MPGPYLGPGFTFQVGASGDLWLTESRTLTLDCTQTEGQTQCRCGICPKFESAPRDCIHSRDRITDLSQEQLAELVARYLHPIRHPAHYTCVSTQPYP